VQLYRYFMSQSSEFCRHNPLCCFSTNVYCCKCIFHYQLSPETFGYILISRPHSYCNYWHRTGKRTACLWLLNCLNVMKLMKTS